MKYKYKDGTYIQVGMNNQQYVNITFTDTLRGTTGIQTFREIDGICWQINDFRSHYFDRNSAFLRGFDSKQFEFNKRRRQGEIERQINSFFGNDRDTILIPSGRSLLSTLSEHLQSLDTHNLDFLMRSFLDRIKNLKPAFSSPFIELVEDRKLNGDDVPDDEILDSAILKMKDILKGEYRVDPRFGERIYFNEENYIKLSMASSGQQEVVWILLQLFILLLKGEKVFLVIEEPEAHLFPRAQKSIVELISLLFNENESQILITTHSPYILTSFNNLIYAGNVGEQHEEVNEIIPKSLWLDFEKVGAYRLANGIAEDLMDKESKMIRAEEIDTVSRTINQDFDALINLELQ